MFPLYRNQNLFISRKALFNILDDILPSIIAFCWLLFVCFPKGFVSTTASPCCSRRSWAEGEISLWFILIQWCSFLYFASDYQVNSCITTMQIHNVHHAHCLTKILTGGITHLGIKAICNLSHCPICSDEHLWCCLFWLPIHHKDYLEMS